METELENKFYKLIAEEDERPEALKEAADLVLNAPESSERAGLLALIYHGGIGVEQDMDRAFGYAEKAALEWHDGLGYYLLGYMCENAETPDQAEGGPRQKYDHYDAERFYELSSKIDSPWRYDAVMWLGDYYMDMAKGGDPEIGVEYYESIAGSYPPAAEALSDYYWDLAFPDHTDDTDWTKPLFKWTKVAEKTYPEEYAYRLGVLYSCGIGCERDTDKGTDLFVKAYEHGDWRGAQAIAASIEELLANMPEMAPEPRQMREDEIRVWLHRAEELRQKDLLENPAERDNAIEED